MNSDQRPMNDRERASLTNTVTDFLQWIDDEQKVSNLTPILEAAQLIPEYIKYLESQDE